MALQYMTKIPGSGNKRDSHIYEAQETRSAGTSGNTILFPNNTGRLNSILLALIVTSGSGKVQFTVSKYSDVMAENADVNWIDWDAGTVSTTTTDEIGPVTAVRMVRTSGEQTLEVRSA